MGNYLRGFEDRSCKSPFHKSPRNLSHVSLLWAVLQILKENVGMSSLTPHEQMNGEREERGLVKRLCKFFFLKSLSSLSRVL